MPEQVCIMISAVIKVELIYLKLKLFRQDRPTEPYQNPDGLVHRDVRTNYFNAIKSKLSGH